MMKIAYSIAVSFVGALLLGGFSAAAQAEWQIDQEQSFVNYVTVKKEHVAEIHQLPDISGSIAADGTLAIDIATDSVVSGVDVRDARLKEFLFKVADFPKISLIGRLDLSEYEELAIGDNQEGYVEAELKILSTQKPIDFDVRVFRLTETKILVLPTQPIIIAAKDVDLVPGILKLQELAKLSSISQTTPITFQLVLEKQ